MFFYSTIKQKENNRMYYDKEKLCTIIKNDSWRVKNVNGKSKQDAQQFIGILTRLDEVSFDLA